MMGKAKNRLGRIFGPTGFWVGIVWKFIAPFLAAVSLYSYLHRILKEGYQANHLQMIFVFSLLTQITSDLRYHLKPT